MEQGLNRLRRICSGVVIWVLLAGCSPQPETGLPTDTLQPLPLEAVPTDTVAAQPTETVRIEPTTTPETAPTITSTEPESIATPTNQATFIESACPFDLPAGQVEGETVDCGFLTVPENRAEPGSKTLHLAVAIFRHPDGDPEPDPIIYLEGGPGGSALEYISLTFRTRFEPYFAANRDLILFDQRGVGVSEPALDCPEYTELGVELLDNEIDGKVLTDAEMYDLSNQYLMDCMQELAQTVDLAQYNTNASAADVEDLRRALGYEQVNLWGISYGTRLALEVMRDYPQGVRSVILDSVVPPEVDIFEETPLNAYRSFETLFSGCANDLNCNREFPVLKSALFSTVTKLNQTPAQFDIFDPLANQGYQTIMDGDSYLSLLFQMLYDSDIIPILPQLIYETEAGNYEKVASLLGVIIATRNATSDGMNLAVNCYEEYPFSSLDEFETNVEQVPDLKGWFEYSSIRLSFAFCPEWQPAQAVAQENLPVLSDLPVLVISGEYDPITPPRYGEQVAENLSRAYVFEFPGLGHGASTVEGCSRDIVLAFWSDPATTPDSSCIAEMDLPKFVTPEGEKAIVLGTYKNDMMGIEGLIPENWEELNTGVFARQNSSLDSTVLLAQAGSNLGIEELYSIFIGQFGLTEEPQVLSQRQANGLTWNLYRFAAQGLEIDMALAETSRMGLVVLLQSSKADREALYGTVFLPVVDALKPSR